MARASTFASRFSPRERARSSIFPLERGIPVTPVDVTIRGRKDLKRAATRRRASLSLDLSYPFRISSIPNLMRNRGRFGASIYPSNAFWIWAITPITVPRRRNRASDRYPTKSSSSCLFLPLFFFSSFFPTFSFPSFSFLLLLHHFDPRAHFTSSVRFTSNFLCLPRIR